MSDRICVEIIVNEWKEIRGITTPAIPNQNSAHVQSFENLGVLEQKGGQTMFVKFPGIYSPGNISTQNPRADQKDQK